MHAYSYETYSSSIVRWNSLKTEYSILEKKTQISQEGLGLKLIIHEISLIKYEKFA